MPRTTTAWPGGPPSPDRCAPRLVMGAPAPELPSVGAARGPGEPGADAPVPLVEVRPRHVRIELAGYARPVATARRTVTEHCLGRISPDVIDDLRIIVSELVSNVLEHGGGPHGLTLELTIRAREVDVQVTGVGDRRQVPPSSEWRLPPPLQRTGRGLALVRRLSPWVTVDGDDAVRDRGGWIAILASLPIRTV